MFDWNYLGNDVAIVRNFFLIKIPGFLRKDKSSNST